MGLPTTTTGPTNVYFLQDDTGTSAGPTGGTTGGGSGNQILVEFVAPNITAAGTVAYLVASALQRPVRLVTKYGGTPPWTLVTGIAATNSLTSIPSGITY
jgi:hypothetical protein